MRVKYDDQKGWEEPGRVVEQCASRSYIVETPSGQRRRDHRHLKVVPEGVDDGQSSIITDLREDGASVPLPVPEGVDGGQSNIITDLPEDGASVPLPVP